MSQEKTVEELIYELGNGSLLLALHRSQLEDINEQEFHVVKGHYDAFKTRALKLGVELPDLPEDNLSQKFLDDQISKVQEYIKLHKTESMAQLFDSGHAAEFFLRMLVTAKVIKFETPEEGHSKKLETIVPMANQQQCWTLSLVRLPDRSNPQHAFLLLAGEFALQGTLKFKLSQEKTVEELIYELGNGAQVLALHRVADINVTSISDVQRHYNVFKTRALKLGVELPDLSEDNLSQKFLDDQITAVWEYVKLHKTGSMVQLFDSAYAAEEFLRVLVLATLTCKTPEDEHTKKLKEFANKCLQSLIKHAKELDVDRLGDQLEEELKDICDNYMNFKFDQSLEDSIRVKLKKKLCGPRSEIPNPPPPQLESSSTVYKRSEVDPTRIITDQCWTVSLVRLPDRSNPQHAFIVLEGKTGRKSKIWFADFVAVHWFDVVRPGTEDGKVRMEYYDSEGVADPTSRLLFKCQKRMMDVRASDRLLFSTWPIAKTTAEILIQMIEAQQKNPPKYHMLGDNSVLAGSSAKSSSNTTGHNCFTFAKMMLRDLNDVYIELPDDGLETWIIGSATSRYLVDKQLTRRKWYETSSFQLTVGFLVGLLVAFFLLKAF
ncbi:hypothetical protein ACROYT_G005722 [Oculina patagonica]